MVTMFYKKDLNKPWILIIQFHLNRLKNVKVVFVFEYLQMDCNGSGHIEGLVTSLSLM